MRTVIITYILFACFGCSDGNRAVSYQSLNPKASDSLNSPIDTFNRKNCDSLRDELSRTKSGNFGKVTRIPINFEKSLLQLDTLINPQIREWIRCLPDGDFSSYVHHDFGMYLRNSWGLWQKSRLAENLYAMGMLHPDDMTAIILTSYQRRLKGEEIRVQEQLKYYQDYWRKIGMPVDSILKANNEKKKGG
jgi:hypothetical protein